jgi:CHASE2 domain-containing sensor protein
MKYYDLDIRIGSQVQDHYPVQAESESMGEAKGILPLASVDLLRTKVTEFGRAEFDDKALNELGASLFDALFPESIGTLYQRALGQVYADDSAGVRIRLRIEPPEIAALPWEQIYDASRECFLATSKETLLVRYTELSKPIRSLQTALPIRILILIPEGSGLDVEAEKDKVLEALASLNNAIETEVLQGRVTSASISQALVRKQFHILHFIGHGGFRDNVGCLVLNGERDGESDIVGANEFAYHFQDDPCMKLIVLNSCSGAESSTGALTGVAQELVRMGVPAVVAMQREVTDEAAKLFAASFYFKLCVGYEPGRVDIAVAHARKELKRELSHDDEFSNPVLFMRSPKGVIFDLGEGTPVTTLQQLHTTNAISNTLGYNIDQLAKEGGPEAESIIAEEKKAQTKVRARARQFYTQIAKAAAPRVILLGLLMTLGIYVASYARVLNVFRVDDYLGGALRLWSPTNDKRFRQDIRIILAKPGDNGGLGDPNNNPSWRAHHGELLQGLAEVQPRAIVFDTIFDTSRPDFDPKFIEGIKYAQSKGVKVIGSKEIDIDGVTPPNGIISRELEPVFGDDWGDAQVGVQMELPLLQRPLPYINAYEIATLTSEGANENWEFEVEPSLALRTVMRSVTDGNTKTRAFFDAWDNEVVLTDSSSGKAIGPRIPVMRNGRVLDMILEYVNKSDVNGATSDYKYVYDLTKSTRQQEKDELYRLFHNAIVFIAVDTPEDVHADIENTPRVGVTFHANAVSNILNGSLISYVSRVLNLLIIAALVAVGILLQTVVKKRMPHKLSVTLPFLKDIVGPIPIPVGVLLAVVIYLLAAFFVYSQFRVSFDMSYHLAALLFGYWLVAIFRKRLRLAGGAQEQANV